MLGAPADDLDHLGTDAAREHGEQVSRLHPSARGAGLGLEGGAELVEPELVALEAGPCVVEMVGGGDAADEPGREPVLAFVVVERIEGTVGDDTAEVEEHSGDGPRPRGAGAAPGRARHGHRSDCLTSPSHSSADSPRDATSTRSSTPWNMAAYCSNDRRSLKSPKP